MKPPKEVLIWLTKAMMVDGVVEDALFLGDDHFSVLIRSFGDEKVHVKSFHLSEDDR